MMDSGATALFISRRFIEGNRIRTYPLPRQIPLFNIDGTKNRAGGISQAAHLRLEIGGWSHWEDFLVTDLGPENVVLGLPWLRKVNPNVDWTGGTMKIGADREEGEKSKQHLGSTKTIATTMLEKVEANRIQRKQWWKEGMLEEPSEEVWCAAGFTYSTELAGKAGEGKQKRSLEEIIPEEYQQYAKVFSEEKIRTVARVQILRSRYRPQARNPRIYLL